jgi:hypothetical protein
MNDVDFAVRHRVRPGRPEAAAAVWSWNASAAAPRPLDAGPVRLRGALQAFAGLAVAATFFWFGHRVPAAVVGSIAAVVGLSALASPFGVFAAIERGFDALGRGLGRLLGWIVLPAIFYLFFAPFSVLFRRGRRDSMKRAFDAEATSYWTPRDRRSATMGSDAYERPY